MACANYLYTMKKIGFFAFSFFLLNSLSQAREMQLSEIEKEFLGFQATMAWPLEQKKTLCALSPEDIQRMSDSELISITTDAFIGDSAGVTSGLLSNLKEVSGRDENYEVNATPLRVQLRADILMAVKVHNFLVREEDSSRVSNISHLWNQKLKAERLLRRMLSPAAVGGDSPSGRPGPAYWNYFDEEVPLETDPRIVGVKTLIEQINTTLKQAL